QPLVAQLVPGGRLIIPVGDDSGQHLVRVTLETDGQLSEETVDSARFVPLTGEEGW
ncbi:MAG: protein-L-isoaspartate O-methyltransferase, partial [Gemmatimonadetes bacterium]|nr:protein-L-isoaspartate O-methyltransferase [Gemmatimonadota bacterium]